MGDDVKRELREELKASGYTIEPNFLDERLSEKEANEQLQKCDDVKFIKVYSGDKSI